MVREHGHYWVRTKCNESFIARWDGWYFVSENAKYNEEDFDEILEDKIKLSKTARQLEDIKILMERTGLSRLRCNIALFSSDYDIDRAEELLNSDKSK